jgi:hypothetical protein
MTRDYSDTYLINDSANTNKSTLDFNTSLLPRNTSDCLNN